MKIENVLQSFFGPYAQFNAKELEQIQQLIHLKTLTPTACFIREGEVKDDMGIILEGCMRYYYLKDGEEITGEFWQEHELIGSYEGCILKQPSTLFIEAIEPTQLITLSYQRLKELSKEILSLNYVIIGLLEKFIVESQLRIASYITETPEERYLRLREEMPGIEERVHQKYIASFVGVTPVTLSRIRGRLATRRSKR